MTGVDEVISRKTSALEFDIHLPLMSLPGVFNDSLETIPCSVPYLGSPISSSSVAHPKKVGLAWAGSGSQSLDRRSIPKEALAPLLNVSLEWHSLQFGQPVKLPVLDHSADITNFSATADLIQSLDLVISVDTAVAHLAGALGKPVWVLLSQAPDWRWGHEGSTSPWYPTARLFRRSDGETWPTLLNRVALELQNLA